MEISSHFSVRIPYTDRCPTVWHPSNPSSTLVRGAFSSRDEANAWAEKNIKGHEYDVVFYPVFEEPEVVVQAHPYREPSEVENYGTLSDRALEYLLSVEIEGQS